jgi:S-adenosylmethionine synthetase
VSARERKEGEVETDGARKNGGGGALHLGGSGASVREGDAGKHGRGEKGTQGLVLVLYRPREGEGAATGPIGH